MLFLIVFYFCKWFSVHAQIIMAKSFWKFEKDNLFFFFFSFLWGIWWEKKTPVNTFVWANRYLQACVGACVSVCAHVCQCKGRSVCATLMLIWYGGQTRDQAGVLREMLTPNLPLCSISTQHRLSLLLIPKKLLDNRVYMLLRYLNNFKLYIRTIQ